MTSACPGDRRGAFDRHADRTGRNSEVRGRLNGVPRLIKLTADGQLRASDLTAEDIITDQKEEHQRVMGLRNMGA
jgi:hypothetical protein